MKFHKTPSSPVAASIQITALLFCASATAQPPEPPAAAPPVSQSPSPSTRIPVELFTSPKPKHIDAPEFPPDQLSDYNEGWVKLSFMVDPSGKPFEVTVAQSSGNKRFEQIATRALEHSTFEPGMLNGQPVEAGFEMKYKFENTNLTRQPGARREFIRAYRGLESAVKSADRAAADQAMAQLKVTNLYEDAYYGLAQDRYAYKWGTPSEQLAGLQRAIAEEDKAHYLSNELFRAALLDSFRLQVGMRDYAGALTTWKRLLHAGIDKDTVAKYQPVVDHLETIRTDDSAYEVEGTMTDGKWYLHLFKHNFEANVTSGSLTEVKLRCDKHHYFFAFDPKLDYKINPHAGDCSIELLGAPGTRFNLIQF